MNKEELLKELKTLSVEDLRGIEGDINQHIYEIGRAERRRIEAESTELCKHPDLQPVTLVLPVEILWGFDDGGVMVLNDFKLLEHDSVKAYISKAEAVLESVGREVRFETCIKCKNNALPEDLQTRVEFVDGDEPELDEEP